MADLRKTEGNISRADLADYAADNATIISERDRMVGDNQVRNASNTADPNNPTMIGKTLTIEDAPMQRYRELQQELGQLRIKGEKAFGRNNRYDSEITNRMTEVQDEMSKLRKQLGPIGHFGENHLGWYIASFHDRPGGGKTMVVHQLQS